MAERLACKWVQETWRVCLTLCDKGTGSFCTHMHSVQQPSHPLGARDSNLTQPPAPVGFYCLLTEGVGTEEFTFRGKRGPVWEGDPNRRAGSS